MKRWLLYIVIGLASLLLLVVVVTQIVLWTDIPRRIVVGQIESQLGLDVEIDSLSTGWFGRTELEGLTARLPLAEKPLLTAPRVTVDHNSLLGLVWSRAFELDGLRVENPTLIAREGGDAEGGRWNLQELAELLQARLLKDDQADTGPPDLPWVDLRGVTVEVERAGRDAVVLQGVTVVGKPVGGVAYEAKAVVPGVGQVTSARLAVGEPWEHTAEFVLEPEGEVLAGLGVELPGVGTGDTEGAEDSEESADAAADDVVPVPVRVAGSWSGRFIAGVVTGRLELERAATPWAVASGPVGVRVETREGIRVTVEPTGVVVREVVGLSTLAGGGANAAEGGAAEGGEIEGGALRVTRGVVTFDADAMLLAAEGVRLAGLGGAAAVDGRFDLAALSGTGEARWQGITLPTGFVHGGEASATLGQTVLGGPSINAEVTASLASPAGDWNAAATLDLAGRDWQQIAGDVRLSQLAWRQDDESWSLPETVLDVTYDASASQLSLTRLRFEDAQGPQMLDGWATLNLARREWDLDAAASAVDLPMTTLDLTRLEIHASGDARRGVLAPGTQVRLDPFLVEGAGYVEYGVKGIPLELTVTLKEAPLSVGEAVGVPVVAVEALRGEMRLWGLLNEPDVDLQGDLLAQGLRVGGQAVGDITLSVLGNARGVAVEPDGGSKTRRLAARPSEASASASASQNGDEPEKAILVRVSADAVEWLGGQWQLHAAWAQAQRLNWRDDAEQWVVAGLDPESQRIAIFVDAQGIDLTQAQKLAPGIEGVRDGSLMNLDLLAVSDSLDLNTARIERGQFEIRDFAYSLIDTRRITGDLAIDRGTIVVSDLKITQDRVRGVDYHRDELPADQRPGEDVGGRITGEVRLSILGDGPRELALNDVVISQWWLATPDEVRLGANGVVPSMRLNLEPPAEGCAPAGCAHSGHG